MSEHHLIHLGAAMKRRSLMASAVILFSGVGLLGCAPADAGLDIQNLTPKYENGQEARGTAYWLPLDADPSGIPAGDLGDDERCSASFTQWLVEHSRIAIASQQILIANPTKDAVTLTVAPAENAADAAPEPGYYVQCGNPLYAPPDGAGNGVPWRRVTVNLKTADTTDSSTDPAGPFSATLQPGDRIGILLDLNGADHFDGRLRLTAQSDVAKFQDVPILSGRDVSTRIDWPGLDKSFGVLVRPTPSGLQCHTSIGASLACDASKIKELVEAAYRLNQDSSQPSTDIPAEIDGRWCTVTGNDCVDFSELKKKFPDFGFESSSAGDVPGTTNYHMCVTFDMTDLITGAPTHDCSTASSMFFTYFPPGVAWNCQQMMVEEHHWPRCDPDFTSQHDITRGRLIHDPNHRQEDYYIDVPPLYRAD